VGATFFNTAFVLGPAMVRAGVYRKRRLVPFGEYDPLPFGGGRILPGPELVAGEGGAPFAISGASVGVLICFEDVFPEEALARARDADVLAVITNDGWLDAAGRRQHLDIAIVRAIESRRPIARAASTGISAIVDAWGRIVVSREEGSGHAIGIVRPHHEVSVYARAPDAIPILAVIVAVASLVQLALARKST
jgi:apolipoprotein N-acyltransferase